MNIILWIILGGVAGWIASMIMKRSEKQGLLGDIILGIIGAVVGGFVASMLGGQGITGFNIYSFVVALVGAIGVIWVVRAVRGA